MVKTDLVVAMAVLAVALCACGGGGQSLPATPALPHTGSAPAAGSATGPTAAQASATFTITVPPPASTAQVAQRRLQYVSADTTTVYISGGIDVGLCGPGCHQTGTPPVDPLTFPIDSTHCSTNADGSRSCAFTAQEPIGERSYDILGVNLANGVSEPLEVAEAQATVTAGSSNTISAMLDPILAAPTLTAVTSPAGDTTATLTFTYADAMSALIPPGATGSFVDAPSIQDRDTTGQTSLTVNRSTTDIGSTVSLNSTADVVTLNYTPDGASGDQFTLVVATQAYNIYDLNPLNNPFPQAQPQPQPVPASSSTYDVTCSPGRGCQIAAPTSLNVN